MKINRVVISFLALIFCINYTYGIGYYSDVDNHWSREYIYWATNEFNLFNNYSDNSFKPDSFMSRGEYIYLLSNILQAQSMNSNKKINYLADIYTDVNEEHWDYESVTFLIAYINQYTNSNFNFYDIFPSSQLDLDKAITRYEAVLLARAITTPPVLETKEYIFKDLSVNTKYYHDIIELINNGIIGGYGDGTFRLNNNVTRGEAAVIGKRIYDDLKYLKTDYMKISPLGNLDKGIVLPLFEAKNNAVNMIPDDKIFINAITSLEYLSFIGYIPYEERHLYDLNPIDTLWDLKNKDYYNVIGINYYLLKWDKDMVLERRRELILEAIQHYSKITDKRLEGIYSFFEITKDYYKNEELIDIIENIYFNIEDEKESVATGILLSELYLEEKRLDDTILIYQELLSRVDDLDERMKIISNYIYLIYEKSGYNKAVDHCKSLLIDIREHKEYMAQKGEIEDVFTSILKQLKIKANL